MHGPSPFRRDLHARGGNRPGDGFLVFGSRHQRPGHHHDGQGPGFADRPCQGPRGRGVRGRYRPADAGHLPKARRGDPQRLRIRGRRRRRRGEAALENGPLRRHDGRHPRLHELGQGRPVDQGLVLRLQDQMGPDGRPRRRPRLDARQVVHEGRAQGMDGVHLDFREADPSPAPGGRHAGRLPAGASRPRGHRSRARPSRDWSGGTASGRISSLPSPGP